MNSRRKIECGGHDSVAFRFIAANTHPDHDSIATFRRRFLPQIEALFVQVLVLAREMEVPQAGLPCARRHECAANASKHRALSWEHANKIERQLREEVQTLLKLAEESDSRPVNDGLDVPAEVARRDKRLAAIAQAKTRIEGRASLTPSSCARRVSGAPERGAAQRSRWRRPVWCGWSTPSWRPRTCAAPRCRVLPRQHLSNPERLLPTVPA